MVSSDRREREKQVRRDTIVQAARSVFLAKGVASATMSEIAAVAELSKGTLYLYFKSKTALYVAVVQGTFERVIEAVEQAVAAAPDGLSALEALLRTQSRMALTHREIFRVAMSWLYAPGGMPLDGEDASDYLQRMQALRVLVMGCIERGQADGSVCVGMPVHGLAMQIMAGLFGAELFCINRPADVTPCEGQESAPEESLVTGYIDLILRGIAANPGSRPGHRPGLSPTQGDGLENL